MPLTFQKNSDIPDLVIINSQALTDSRGFFMETYKKSNFSKIHIPVFVQENHSYSTKNVLRGLHYQIYPQAQGKLVRCMEGKIFDVAVDIRPRSKTYKKWVSIILSKENKLQFYIPPGFAHGFCVMSDTAEVIYKCTKEYSPKHEKGIIWNDSSIHIDWPIKNPIISPKDMTNPHL